MDADRIRQAEGENADMRVFGSVADMKKARAQLGTPAALNEALVATGIDALFVLLDGGSVRFEDTVYRLEAEFPGEEEE